MATTRRFMDRRNRIPSSLAAGNGEWQGVARRRCDRITLGFWLGGVILGTAGCLLGASMPYHHPVARVISVLWWGIYFGCLGASIGALPGLFLNRTPARLSQQSDGAGRPPAEADSDCRACPTELADYPAVMVVSKMVGTRGDCSAREESVLSGRSATPVGSPGS